MKIKVDAYGKIIETTDINRANRISSDYSHLVVFANKKDIEKALKDNIEIQTPAWAMGSGFHHWNITENGKVSCFGWGNGWQDQKTSYHSLRDAIDYIWKHRKNAKVSNYPKL